MKTKRRKNQMVITALALMIAVAGYLNFSGKEITLLNSGMESNKETAKENENEEEDVAQVDDLDTDIADMAAVEDEDNELASNEEALETDSNEVTDSNSDMASNEDSLEAQASDADEDMLASVDDSEISAKVDDEIEETVSASSSNVANAIMQAQLSKEQNRSKNKELLMDIINNDNVTKAQKEEATNQLLMISDYMEKEAAAEQVLTAKGYKDCMVSMSKDSVDVTVNLNDITDVDRAKIEDVVQRKTGMDVSSIVISTY